MFFSGSMEPQADVLAGSDFAPQGFENKVQRSTLLSLPPFPVFLVGTSGTSEIFPKALPTSGLQERNQR